MWINVSNWILHLIKLIESKDYFILFRWCGLHQVSCDLYRWLAVTVGSFSKNKRVTAKRKLNGSKYHKKLSPPPLTYSDQNCVNSPPPALPSTANLFWVRPSQQLRWKLRVTEWFSHTELHPPDYHSQSVLSSVNHVNF